MNVLDIIKRSRLRKSIMREETTDIDGAAYIRLDAVMEKINMAPSADAVEVVRCKDCKNRGTPYGCPMRNLVLPHEGPGSYVDCTEDDGYCHMGVKKAGGAE